MGEAIGQTLSLGVGVALSPLPIVAVVLMLGTPRARANGPAFLVGWLAGLAAVGTIVLLVSSGTSPSDDGEPATWVSWLELALGALMLLLAVRNWRNRPRGHRAETPAWMKALDSFSAVKSFGLGLALSALNPKNLILTVGAGAAIAGTGIPTGEQFVALAVFVVIGTLGTGLPVAIYVFMGDRAEHLLGTLEAWMARHNTAIMAVVTVLIGAKLVGDAVAGLAR